MAVASFETNLSDRRLSRPRRGVTLIELLIAMAIISMLAALILGVAARAAENARRANTQHTVLRLHRLLMSHYDTYKTRRVGIRDQVEFGIDDLVDKGTIKSSEAGQLEASARLYALRELMLMELPDRWSDVILNAVPSNPSGAGDALYPYFLKSTGSPGTGRSGLASIYLRHYDRIVKGGASREQLLTNQSAECLYLIITLACGEGEARSQFGEGDIGDTDGDGAFEFLDGWGNPISFLRWAPGFDSQVQLDANTLGLITDNSPNSKWNAAASGDHDPFDLFRVDQKAFRLVPLIFSAGGDESVGIETEKAEPTWRGITSPNAASEPDDWYPSQLLPYAQLGVNNVFLGTAIPDAGATDNVHNHLLGRR